MSKRSKSGAEKRAERNTRKLAQWKAEHPSDAEQMEEWPSESEDYGAMISKAIPMHPRRLYL